MVNEPKKPRPQPRFVIDPKLDAVYANIVRIAHTPSEIMIDFAHLLPGDKGARVKSRVVMSPLSAKLMYRALGENLSRYEAAFGEIPVPKQQSLADFLFKPPEGDKDDSEEEGGDDEPR